MYPHFYIIKLFSYSNGELLLLHMEKSPYRFGKIVNFTHHDHAIWICSVTEHCRKGGHAFQCGSQFQSQMCYQNFTINNKLPIIPTTPAAQSS